MVNEKVVVAAGSPARFTNGFREPGGFTVTVIVAPDGSAVPGSPRNATKLRSPTKSSSPGVQGPVTERLRWFCIGWSKTMETSRAVDPRRSRRWTARSRRGRAQPHARAERTRRARAARSVRNSQARPHAAGICVSVSSRTRIASAMPGEPARLRTCRVRCGLYTSRLQDMHGGDGSSRPSRGPSARTRRRLRSSIPPSPRPPDRHIVAPQRSHSPRSPSSSGRSR